MTRRRLWTYWGIAALGAESLMFYMLLSLFAAPAVAW